MTWLKNSWFFILALLAPLVFSDPYILSILIAFCIFAILSTGLNIVTGYLGELSFGHAAFFGIGAYASAILTKSLGLSFWLAIWLAILSAGIVGTIVAFLSLRLKGAYFAIVTLAFAEIMRLVVLNWVGLTKGPMGFTGIPRVTFFGFEFSTPLSYYYLVLCFLALALYFTSRLVSSKSGRAFVAVREQPDLAKSIGVDVFKTKIVAFAVSTMLAGLAGVLYAHFYRILMPEQLGLYYTTTALVMVMVGGRGTLWGPVAGAFIFTVIPEFLRMAGELRLILFAVILGLSCIFMPEGITTTVRRMIAAAKTKKVKLPVPESAGTEG